MIRRALVVLINAIARPIDALLMRTQARLDDDHPLTEYRNKEGNQ